MIDMHSHVPSIQTNKQTNTDTKMCSCLSFAAHERVQFRSAYSPLSNLWCCVSCQAWYCLLGYIVWWSDTFRTNRLPPCSGKQ